MLFASDYVGYSQLSCLLYAFVSLQSLHEPNVLHDTDELIDPAVPRSHHLLLFCPSHLSHLAQVLSYQVVKLLVDFSPAFKWFLWLVLSEQTGVFLNDCSYLWAVAGVTHQQASEKFNDGLVIREMAETGQTLTVEQLLGGVGEL